MNNTYNNGFFKVTDTNHKNMEKSWFLNILEPAYDTETNIKSNQVKICLEHNKKTMFDILSYLFETHEDIEGGMLKCSLKYSYIIDLLSIFYRV
jgi:hypothetical protein